ncbi:hypothetical protein ACFY8X_23635 [Streptomyces tanashiensis]|uniref:hypothetical protein n=1 Tax=Streptomyces tanashiensis TaxID=67367 RepID=UPI0036E47277
MTTVDTLPHRHVLAALTVPAWVRLARETAEACVLRRDADGGGKSVWITLPL